MTREEQEIENKLTERRRDQCERTQGERNKIRKREYKFFSLSLKLRHLVRHTAATVTRELLAELHPPIRVRVRGGSTRFYEHGEGKRETVHK